MTRLYWPGAHNAACVVSKRRCWKFASTAATPSYFRGSGGSVWRGATVVGCVTRSDRRPWVRGWGFAYSFDKSSSGW
jgi:hypothetical protein